MFWMRNKWRYIHMQCISLIHIMLMFRASLKQTWGCGSLCWCYHSNTLTAMFFQFSAQCETENSCFYGTDPVWRECGGVMDGSSFTVQTNMLVQGQDQFQHYSRSAQKRVRFHSAMTTLQGRVMICKISFDSPNTDKSNTEHLRQWVMILFVHLTSEKCGPQRQRVPATSCGASLRWNREEEAALAAADGHMQGEHSLTLQTGTVWHCNNKLLRVREQREVCRCKLQVSHIRFTPKCVNGWGSAPATLCTAHHTLKHLASWCELENVTQDMSTVLMMTQH